MSSSRTEKDSIKKREYTWWRGEYYAFWRRDKRGRLWINWIRLLLHTLSPVTIGIFILCLGIFLALFFGVEEGWAALGFAIAFQLYAYLVIGYLIYTIIYEYKQPNLHSPLLPFLELVMLYLYLVVHNTMLYAGISLVDKNTFIGIEPDFPRWVVLKNTLFLATGMLS